MPCPYISGYKPRFNYQQLLRTVLYERLKSDPALVAVVATDADANVVAPPVTDILACKVAPPAHRAPVPVGVPGNIAHYPNHVNFLQREASNRKLGFEGELFVVRYERARLISLGLDRLAAKVEHVSQTRGDGYGFDVLSFDGAGDDRLIEVKTTKYGIDTPFFVSQNERLVSEANESQYHLYRVHGFRASPHFFALCGALSNTCELDPSVYRATAK